MRLADFPLFDADVYVVRADVSAPKLLNPLTEVRARQDDAGYTWLAQGKGLVELDRNAGRKPFLTAIA